MRLGIKEIEQILSDTILMEPVRYNELRYTRDDRNESLGKKIREAAAWKVPIQLIVGSKDKESREVSVRLQDREEKVQLDHLGEFLRSL